MTTNIYKKIVDISNEIRIEKTGKNSFTNYDYFTPDGIANALNPLLQKYQIICLFNMEYSTEMYHGILTIKDTEDLSEVIYKFDIPKTEVKGASAGQNAGATLTYCKRYMLMSAFNIADNKTDLDNIAKKKEIKTTNYLEQLKSQVYKAGAKTEKEAIDLINKKTGLKLTDMKLTEKHAEQVLFKFLQK